MSLMQVPTSRHGDSLPAELRVRGAFRGSTYFPGARLAYGQKGLTEPPDTDADTETHTPYGYAYGYRARRDALSGLRGLAQCIDPVDGSDIPCGDGGGTGTCVGVCPQGQTWDTGSCSCIGNGVPVGGGSGGGFTGGCPGTCTGANMFMDQSTCTCVSGGALPPTVTPSQIPGYGGPTGYSGPSVLPPGAVPPAAPPGYQWASLINASGQNLARVLAISQGGSAITLPNGQQLLFGSAASAAAGSLLGTNTLGGMMPILLIAGGFLLLMTMRK
jgi:hypothetical protein